MEGIIAEKDIPEQELENVIVKAGYGAVSVSSESYKNKGHQSALHTSLCANNDSIMYPSADKSAESASSSFSSRHSASWQAIVDRTYRFWQLLFIGIPVDEGLDYYMLMLF